MDDEIICAKDFCRCQPNYYWSKDECEYYTCHKDNDCQEYDPHRLCVNGRCVCNQYYSEERTSLFCYPKISGDCSTNFDCRATGDANTYCVGGKCRCKANYFYEGSICAKRNCQQSTDCWEYDKNRECVKAQCVCRSGTKESKEDNTCR